MKHILVPVGSTENARNTLQYAIDLAEEIAAKVFVLRAYRIQTPTGTLRNVDEFLERESNLYMRAVISSVNVKNVDVKLISAKGNVLESITSVDKELGVDLIVMGPKSNSIKDEVFLGSTSGSVLKQTDIPMLIVPDAYTFKPFTTVLTAFKSGVMNKERVLYPLQQLVSKYSPTVNLLLVKTPGHTDEDLVLDNELEAIKTNLTITENATTFQGVLERFQSHNPDLLCVFRRKRGFFKKLWEKNTILKEEFHCSIPLLVLRGKM